MALANQNADMVKQNPDYVVRITGSDTYGKSKLDYFISVGSKYPVIATTSKLLSTGSDCKMTKLIVLDEMIQADHWPRNPSARKRRQDPFCCDGFPKCEPTFCGPGLGWSD